jgi:hypothetical protein
MRPAQVSGIMIIHKRNIFGESIQKEDVMKSLILYWSAGGNTEKVASTIYRTLADNDISADFMQLKMMLK